MFDRLRAWIALTGLVLVPAACGGDDPSKAQSACDDLVEAFARTWERCERGSYDSARQLWSDAFACDTVKQVDDARVDQCVQDIQSQSCSINGTPASCRDVLSGN